MIHIRLKSSVFDPVTGIGAFKGVSARRQAKMFYTVDSSGSEIGVIPFRPALMTDVGGVRPWGQNSYRTLNISLNPIDLDETLIAKPFVSNQGYIINKLVTAIDAGIIEITKDANTTPLTALEFSTLIYGA